MVSSKGKPTDPKLKEKVTEEVKQQPNKDGSGKGQMAAWKAAKIGKEYEARGGDYDNEPGSKNKPQKGPPEKKSASDKENDKPKANIGKKAAGRPKGAAGGAKKKKEVKEVKEGTRKSARQAEGGGKRKSSDDGEEPKAKKAKSGGKK